MEWAEVATLPATWRFTGPSPRVVTLTEPAAGAEWTWPAPTDRLLRVVTVRYKLVTKTTAGTRKLGVKVKSLDGQLLAFTPVVGTVSTTATATLTAWPNAPAVSTPITHLTTPTPRVTFPPGSKVSSEVATLQATDQLSTVVLVVELV